MLFESSCLSNSSCWVIGFFGEKEGGEEGRYRLRFCRESRRLEGDSWEGREDKRGGGDEAKADEEDDVDDFVDSSLDDFELDGFKQLGKRVLKELRRVKEEDGEG